MPSACPDLTAPNTSWNFCPSLGAAYLFMILFLIVTLAHVYQAVLYRKGYCWVISMGALWQLIAYILRILSIHNPSNSGEYATWFTLILVAPLWTNAFVYMVVGRMVWNFTPTARLYFIPAWRFGLYFVALDVSAFIIQVAGAVSATQNQNSLVDVMQGLHIYMVGVGIQQLFIIGFFVFAFKLQKTLTIQKTQLADSKPFTLLYILYAILVLITIRIIFRLVEYSQGLNSTIPNHEAFQYCLDSLPMLVAFVLLNVIHPGQVMPGKECELPSRRERKRNLINTKSDMGSGISVDQNTEMAGV